jgi:hypothetical protein
MKWLGQHQAGVEQGGKRQPFTTAVAAQITEAHGKGGGAAVLSALHSGQQQGWRV